ncbi:MAG: energy-coupling factor transporter transmembrane protein EcfT [Firmicutes bacterium]|nr:energy-coupling factor transporter transmembrane protein EcfT [Bacillota bacterium]MCL5040245.1 energy-coupling factor transporter transmembrane protein EcfT [Bacillota bacterium]
MDLAYIDNLAYSGTGPLHRANAKSKAAFVLVTLAGAIVNRHPLYLGLVGLGVLGLSFLEGLPWRRFLSLSLYPAFLALLFGLAFSQPEWRWIVLLRALASSLTVLLFLATTPYTEIFYLLRRLLPPTVIDGLFLTYRSIFLLLEGWEKALVALRLKGADRDPRAIVSALGLTALRAVDMAGRLEKIMVLRGYEAGSFLRTSDQGWHGEDYWLWGFSLVLAVLTFLSFG